MKRFVVFLMVFGGFLLLNCHLGGTAVLYGRRTVNCILLKLALYSILNV